MTTATSIETHATLNSMIQRVYNDTTTPRPVRFATGKKSDGVYGSNYGSHSDHNMDHVCHLFFNALV